MLADPSLDIDPATSWSIPSHGLANLVITAHSLFPRSSIFTLCPCTIAVPINLIFDWDIFVLVEGESVCFYIP